jgi:predicted HAD superfamily Cof-like phosphohydrolase
MSLETNVIRFMHAGDQSTDHFNVRQSAFYLGMQLEELAEKMKHIAGDDQQCLDLSTVLDQFGEAFKRGTYDGHLARATAEQRAEFIDADFDLAWVSIASLASQGVPVPEVIAEGSYSNLVKIGPDGKCVKDKLTGKILKPAGWKPPNFRQFVTDGASA